MANTTTTTIILTATSNGVHANAAQTMFARMVDNKGKLIDKDNGVTLAIRKSGETMFAVDPSNDRAVYAVFINDGAWAVKPSTLPEDMRIAEDGSKYRYATIPEDVLAELMDV